MTEVTLTTIDGRKVVRCFEHGKCVGGSNHYRSVTVDEFMRYFSSGEKPQWWEVPAGWMAAVDPPPQFIHYEVRPMNPSPFVVLESPHDS